MSKVLHFGQCNFKSSWVKWTHLDRYLQDEGPQVLNIGPAGVTSLIVAVDFNLALENLLAILESKGISGSCAFS